MFNKLVRALPFSEHASRIPVLDGVRGVAVLLVFGVHQDSLFRGFLHCSDVLSRLSVVSAFVGNTGVDIFFVLSGYLIYSHLVRQTLPINIGAFYRKRVKRIYPTFLVVLCTYILISLCWPAVSKIPTGQSRVLYLLANLLLLPGLAPIPPLVTVAWSLSYEALFYLTIPILVSYGRVRNWPQAGRLGFFGGLLLAHCILYSAGIVSYIRLVMFTIGVLVCELSGCSLVRRVLSPNMQWLGLCFWITALAVYRNMSEAFWTVILGTAIGFNIGALVASPTGPVTRVLNSRVLRGLGAISYSFFLSHGLVLRTTYWMFDYRPSLATPVGYLLSLMVNLLFSLLVGSIFYVLVEEPLSLRGRTILAQMVSGSTTKRRGVTTLFRAASHE